jgi:hypothetical protein
VYSTSLANNLSNPSSIKIGDKSPHHSDTVSKYWYKFGGYMGHGRVSICEEDLDNRCKMRFCLADMLATNFIRDFDGSRDSE